MTQHRLLNLTVVLIMVLAAVLAPATGASAWAPRPAGPAGRHARLLSSTSAGVTFQVDVPWESLRAEPATAGAKAYVRVALPAWPTAGLAGAPALPLLAESIGVPFGAALSVQVETGPAHTIALPAPVLPVATQQAVWEPATLTVGLPPELKDVVEEDPAIYAGSGSYPRALAAVASDGVVRQQRVAGIAAYPVQYRPSAQELTVYEWLKVTVKFARQPGLQEPAALGAWQRPAPESAAYENLFDRELLNHASARPWRQAVAPSSIQVERAEAGASAEAATFWTPPDPGWRVKVREDAFYKLSYAELSTAGLPVATLDPRTFRLLYLGTEVAIEVVGEADGHFDPPDPANPTDQGDYLVFYGQAIASKYTRDNVYWLTYGKAQGLRVASRDGTPADAATPTSYPAKRHFEANRWYRSLAPGDDALDRFLWDYLYPNPSPSSKPTWTYTYTLAGPAGGPATLRVALLGYLQYSPNPDHHVLISLNGIQVSDVRWDGITWQTVEAPIPAGLLVAGNNTIQVTAPNDTGAPYDVIFIDWAEIEFANTFLAEDNALAFSYSTIGTWKFQIGGFSASPLAVYDVTHPYAVVKIPGVAVPHSAPYYAEFQDTVAAPASYWALAAYQTAQAIEPDTPSNLQLTANGADHIIITHSAFTAQVAPLRDFRASQGLRAVLVDVQDVYDEFGYGIAGPAAIHDFLAYAYANWQAPAPSYVLLVGDASYDPKDYLNQGRVDYLPAYLAAVDPGLLETAADNRYVTLVGDDNLPDMMLGRLAVGNAAEAEAFVNKILAYEQSPAPSDWRGQVLAVADNADRGGDFPRASDGLLSCCLPQSYVATKVYWGVTHSVVTDAQNAIKAGINAGKLIVNYFGHGATDMWANEGLFKAADVPSLANGSRLPVVLAMTCLEGAYQNPTPADNTKDAMAEVITRAAGNGAVASWSPTGLGYSYAHDVLARGFYNAVFQDGQRTLGQATNAGKLNLAATGISLDMIDTYLLFGDPATRLALPAVPASADLQVSVTASPSGPVLPGATIEYTINFANNGPDTAAGAVLSDPLPAQLINPTVVSSSGASLSLRAGTTFAWDVADLASGAGGSVTVRGTVNPALAPLPATIVNTASITAAEADPSTPNNVASVSTQVNARYKIYLGLIAVRDMLAKGK